jgi:hypothetical protein
MVAFGPLVVVSDDTTAGIPIEQPVFVAMRTALDRSRHFPNNYFKDCAVIEGHPVAMEQSCFLVGKYANRSTCWQFGQHVYQPVAQSFLVPAGMPARFGLAEHLPANAAARITVAS